MCTYNVILCTRYRPIRVFTKIVLGKRLWLKHVCKATRVLQFYTGSSSEAVFAPLRLPRRGMYCFFGITAGW